MQDNQQRTTLTVDVVLVHNERLLLIQRRKWPFEGMWALPGGKVEAEDQTLEKAAKREIGAETGVVLGNTMQIGTFADIGRDPRPGRWVSVAFLAELSGSAPAIVAGSDAASVQWFPLGALPPLAFDHAEIVATALTQRLATQEFPAPFKILSKDAANRLEDEANVTFEQRGGLWHLHLRADARVLKAGRSGAFYFLIGDVVYSFDGWTFDIMAPVSEGDWKSRFANAPYLLDATV